MARSIETVRTNLSENVGWLALWVILAIALIVLICIEPALLADTWFTLLMFIGFACYCLTNVLKYRLEYKEALATLTQSTDATRTRP